MSRIIRESLIWRLIAGLYAWYRRTFLARGVDALGRLWRQSGVYRLFARLLTAPTLTEKTGYGRLLDRLNRGLHRLGRVWREDLETSFFRRIYAKLLSILRGSRLLGWLFSGGITTTLLCVIAAFAVIDYLLRDVLQLAAIASVWDEALLLVGFAWVLFRRMRAASPVKSAANATDLFLAFYLIAGVVILIWSRTNLAVNITGYRASMQYILVFFLVTRLLDNDSDFEIIYKLMVMIAFVIALHGIYQFIIGVEIPSEWTDQAEDSVRTRVFSIFSNPNIMGAYMLLFAPMAIGLAYATENTAWKLFYWVCGLTMCVGCLFTMSRGAWLALAIAAVIFAAVIDRKLLAVMLVGGVCACFLPFVRSRISYLFTYEFVKSNARGGRSMRWAKALGYLDAYDRWTWGMGYGIYGGAVAAQNHINLSLDYMYVDNYYVKILTENGIVGICSFGTMLLGFLWNGLRAIGRTSGSRFKPLCTGMFAGLVGILVHSIFESLWEEPYMMALFFAVAGMLIYAGFLRRKEA